jgi:hypothetical protein
MKRNPKMNGANLWLNYPLFINHITIIIMGFPKGDFFCEFVDNWKFIKIARKNGVNSGAIWVFRPSLRNSLHSFSLLLRVHLE